MTEVIYHKNIYILLVDEVTLTVYKNIFNIRSPLMKTLDFPECRNVGSWFQNQGFHKLFAYGCPDKGREFNKKRDKELEKTV